MGLWMVSIDVLSVVGKAFSSLRSRLELQPGERRANSILPAWTVYGED